MKKILQFSPVFLCILNIIFPLCKIIGFLTGYDFSLTNTWLSIVILAIISFLFTLLLYVTKAAVNKTNAVFSVLLPIFAAINGICFIVLTGWKPAVLFAIICWVCSMGILFKFGRPGVLKVVSAVISILLGLFLLFAAFIMLIFGSIGTVKVVREVPSPQNTYVAEVIDDNQGALGGNTIVQVQGKSKLINVVIGTFLKKPADVYYGRWGEFQTMQISWQDEQTLLINEKEYNISEWL